MDSFVNRSRRSQAARLPKQCRLDREDVQPIPETWDWLDAMATTLDADCVEAAKEQPEPFERPGLDKLFGR